MWTAKDFFVPVVKSSVPITNHWRTTNPIVILNNKVPPNTASANCVNIADVLGEILRTLVSPCHGGGWRCLTCGKTAKTKQHIKNHAEIHLEGVSNVCPFCSKEFKTSNVLQNHISMKHKNSHEWISINLCQDCCYFYIKSKKDTHLLSAVSNISVFRCRVEWEGHAGCWWVS